LREGDGMERQGKEGKGGEGSGGPQLTFLATPLRNGWLVQSENRDDVPGYPIRPGSDFIW